MEAGTPPDSEKKRPEGGEKMARKRFHCGSGAYARSFSLPRCCARGGVFYNDCMQTPRMPPLFVFAALLTLLAAMAAGGEARPFPPSVPDRFDAAESTGETPAANAFATHAARRPDKGEWLEYRLAIPVDPLENSLGPNPLPFPGRDSPPPVAGESLAYFSAFDLPTLWRSIPLRLEILRVDEASCRVRMTFAGHVSETTIPLFASTGAEAFRYPPPQPLERREVRRIGERDYEGELTIRRGRGYGFARLSHPDIPFGLLRFASENMDLILVGMGAGTPPPYPLPDADIIPPPGGLYVIDEVGP